METQSHETHLPVEAGIGITKGEAEAWRGYVIYLGSLSSIMKLKPNVICLQSCLPSQSHSMYQGLILCEQAAINQDQQNTYFEVIEQDKGHEILVRYFLGNNCSFSASPSWQDTSINANKKQFRQVRVHIEHSSCLLII